MSVDTVHVWQVGTASPAPAGLAGPPARRAAGSMDQTVPAWDVATRHHEYTIPIDSDVAALASVDGGIAVGCRDGLLVFDLNPEP